MRIYLRTVICLTACGVGQLSVGEETRAPTSQTVNADLYFIKDICRVPLREMGRNPHRAWLLLKITPGAESGGGRIQGAYVKADTGEAVISPDAKLVITCEGVCDVLAVLADTSQNKNITYRWTEGLKRNASPEDLARSPLRQGGGIAICEIEEGLKAPENFKQVFLVPPDWKEHVAPACEYTRVHQALFDETLETNERPQLEALCKDKNPLLSIWAYKMLTAHVQQDAATMKLALIERNPLQRAAFVFLSFSSVHKISAEGVHEMEKFIAQCTDGGPLRAIALGATANLNTVKREKEDISKHILQATYDKYASLQAQSKIKPDGYLDYLFLITGIHK